MDQTETLAKNVNNENCNIQCMFKSERKAEHIFGLHGSDAFKGQLTNLGRDKAMHNFRSKLEIIVPD